MEETRPSVACQIETTSSSPSITTTVVLGAINEPEKSCSESCRAFLVGKIGAGKKLGLLSSKNRAEDFKAAKFRQN